MPRMFCRRELSKNICVFFSEIFLNFLYFCIAPLPTFPLEFIALCILKSCACVLAINKLIAICAPLAPAGWHFRFPGSRRQGPGEVLAGATFPTREPTAQTHHYRGTENPSLWVSVSAVPRGVLPLMPLTFRIEFHQFAVVVVEAAFEHGSRLRHALLIPGSVQFRGTHNQAATAIKINNKFISN